MKAKVEVEWDFEAQDATVKFNTDDFKTWAFVEAVLRLGARKAEISGQMAMAAAMQKQAMEAAQMEQVRRAIGGRVN